MEVDFIECKNLDYEEPTPYEDFAKGIDGSLGVRLDSGIKQKINPNQCI